MTLNGEGNFFFLCLIKLTVQLFILLLVFSIGLAVLYATDSVNGKPESLSDQMKDYEADNTSSTSTMDVFMVLNISDSQIKLDLVLYLVVLVYPIIILLWYFKHSLEDDGKTEQQFNVCVDDPIEKLNDEQFSNYVVMIRNLPQNIGVYQLQLAIDKIMSKLTKYKTQFVKSRVIGDYHELYDKCEKLEQFKIDKNLMNYPYQTDQ